MHHTGSAPWLWSGGPRGAITPLCNLSVNNCYNTANSVLEIHPPFFFLSFDPQLVQSFKCETFGYRAPIVYLKLGGRGDVFLILEITRFKAGIV